VFLEPGELLRGQAGLAPRVCGVSAHIPAGTSGLSAVSSACCCQAENPQSSKIAPRSPGRDALRALKHIPVFFFAEGKWLLFRI